MPFSARIEVDAYIALEVITTARLIYSILTNLRWMKRMLRGGWTLRDPRIDLANFFYLDLNRARFRASHKMTMIHLNDWISPAHSPSIHFGLNPLN